MRFALRFAVAVAALLAGPAWSAGGGTDPAHAEPKDPALAAIQSAVARSDWAQARTLARAAIEKDGRNAGYHDLAKAREQLKALDDLCFFSCPEFTMLKKAIADYEAKQPK
jgi:hypothetical protein